MQVALLLLFVAGTAATLLLRSKLLLLGLRLVFRRRSARKQYKASPIPGPPAAGSILGHAPDILSARGPWIFSAWANKFGPLFKVQLLDNFAVVLTDPDSISRLTRKTGPGPYLPKPHVIYSAIEGPLGSNIVTAGDDAYWRAVRQAAAPCLSMSNLKQVVPLVLELSARAADHISSHSSFDVTNAAKRVTSDVMGHLLYGEDLRGVTWEPNEYLDSFNILLKAAAARLNNPLHMLQLWDPEVRLQRRCSARQSAVAAERARRMRQNPPEPHTIAAHILSVVDPVTGQPLSDRRVIAEVAAFMGAGFETTSHTITWALTLLAAHPDIQDDLFSELQAAGLAAQDGGTTPGRGFTASDLNRLPLLSAVIKETLRLCEAAPFGGSREVVNEEGADICGFHVPKGTVVMLPTLPYGLSQLNYGSDALVFKPQRWMAAGQAAGVHAADDATAAGADSDSNSSSTPVAPEPAGPGAAELAPERGMDAAAVAGVTAGVSGASQLTPPPEHIAFLTGTRDCIGQNLAKLELQVVLATWLGRFRFSPGPELERELQVAAATGQPVVAAVHALAGAFVTLQPLSGRMELRLEARA